MAAPFFIGRARRAGDTINERALKNLVRAALSILPRISHLSRRGEVE